MDGGFVLESTRFRPFIPNCVRTDVGGVRENEKIPRHAETQHVVE
jgi:hypothetical protein